MRKVFVDVLAQYDTDGRILPVQITWEDGRTWEVDRILDMRPGASLKVGGAGMRYLVRIGHTETYLFLEESKWFVEAK